MPKCPKCNADIAHLDYHEEKSYDSEVRLVDDKLEHSDEFIETEGTGYSCPICEGDIAKSEEEAIKFLEGDKQP